MLEATTSPLVLRRKFRLAAGRDQLEWLCRPLLAEGAECTVQVAAGGKQLDELRIAHDEQMSGPRRTSLTAFVGREVEISLTLTTAKTPLTRRLRGAGVSCRRAIETGETLNRSAHLTTLDELHAVLFDERG